ncbi:MAG: replication-associated recombination protein A [Epsilonproteobacteria bacterium]|nr:MAG: replication-associated recombination protein A [Campylobacterota bacterium]RLA65674.1 MAG: replication-associated recombination protein A [Campylobacterota bacterium]
MGLFACETKTPLAFRARPTNLTGFIGQDKMLQRYSFLTKENFPSIVFWGPPGTGKTTLAFILAQNSDKEIYKFNAVLGGVNDLKKLIKSALELKNSFGKESIIFIDEIHRFNKAQQDALLPHIESGSFTMIGATTENPRSSINRALLSRIQIVELSPLTTDNIATILKNTCTEFSITLDDSTLQFIADYTGGDARKALNILDIVNDNQDLTAGEIKSLILENARDYDKNQDRHYDVISAFIKSMRGSDPQAAILWLAIMLDGGEDPVFIARRLVIFASEDIGNADPLALMLATSALTAVSSIGMPEARINLAQATTYLASTVKSNAAYKAINEAMDFVKEKSTTQVPDHLKSFPPKGTPPYKYPHKYPNHFVKQEYTNEVIPKFYNPSDMGREKALKERLSKLWD